MQIQFSGRYAAIIVDEFKEDWDKIFSESKKVPFGMRSAEPQSVLQIIGELIDWTLPLKVAATAFLTQLAKEAAKDIWKNRKKVSEILQNETCSKLSESVKIIKRAISKSENQCSFIITLYYPAKYIETELVIKSEDEVEISWLLANFIANLDFIYNAIVEELKGENPPSQLIFLSIDETGSIIMKWMDSIKLEKHERIIKSVV